MKSDSYDDIPYDSTPFAETHPDHLCVLGRLFGLATTLPANARILELGCATGGNIIPIAHYLPDAQILGIELSAAQVASAQQLIKQLGLGNIEVRQGDIMELDTGLGKFDYIIVHGVYSWVPEVVREHILALSQQLLTEYGIAYISYNTLPGWRMRGILRDMLLYHARNASTPREKLAKAYELFDLMEKSTHGLDALSVKYLRNEISSVRKVHPSYLYHEYMEEINQAFLFSQFADDANRHGLQYLCDVELGTAFPSTISEAADTTLDAIEDFIELEQYMDFVRNRNFRRSLLCRQELNVKRELVLEQFESFAFNAQLMPPKKLDLSRPREQKFTSADGNDFDVSHPLTKAALLHLNTRHPDTISFAELSDAATQLVNSQGGRQYASQIEHLFGELFSLYAHQAIRISPQSQQFAKSVHEYPRLHRLALAQAKMNLGHLATVRHTTVQLDAFAAHLARLLDGSRNIDELTNEMMAAVANKEVLLNEGKQKTDQKKQLGTVRHNTERLLHIFARQGLLI
ncbi:MAG: methyltransferase regulatory domain-containing protein [Thiohalomonadaceae bacterium]